MILTKLAAFQIELEELVKQYGYKLTESPLYQGVVLHTIFDDQMRPTPRMLVILEPEAK